MKLFISLILAITLISPINKSYAISFSKGITPSVSSSSFVLNEIMTSEFIKLSPGDVSVVTGKKLSFFEKLSLKVLQMKMKHYLKKHPDGTVADYYKGEGKRNFNLLWFLLGLLVPGLSLLIFSRMLAFSLLLAISPVILALITKQERAKIKSVLLGFGINVLLALIFFILLIATFKFF
ncbi:MAG: hypothetical protein M3040_05875 [Bacteroidota bacterium]|nr:hypothetical protein [Bacteroidota bacterium]